MHLGDVSPLVIHDHRYVDMQTQNSCWQCGDVVECEGAAGSLLDAELQNSLNPHNSLSGAFAISSDAGSSCDSAK